MKEIETSEGKIIIKEGKKPKIPKMGSSTKIVKIKENKNGNN